jgi:hypothetical protein
VDEAEQQVLGPDGVVVEHPRFVLGKDDDTAGPLGEALEHEARIGGLLALRGRVILLTHREYRA